MHVPEGWKIVQLESCVSLMKSGLSRKLSSEDIGLPVIRSGNIGNKYTEYNDVKYWYTDDPQGADTKNYILEDGDLLVNFINSASQIGKTCIYRNDLHRNCIYTTNILRVKPSPKIDSVYLYAITKTAKYEVYIQSITKPAVNQASFTTKEFKKFEIFLPPLPEQQKIAQILSAWDKAIEKLEALIAAKQKRKKALMQQLLTGKKRFAEFVRSEEKQKTKFGIIPSEWKYIHIGEIAKQISVKNNDSHDLQVLSCTKHHGLVDSLSYFGKQIFSKDTSTYKIVPRNSFAYATNHIEEGSIGYQNICDEALISPMYTVFQTERGINDNFLYRLLKTELYRHIFEINTNASVDRRGSLRWNQFSHIKIPVPGLNEQQKIAFVFSAADKEIENHQNQLSALKQQKKGLMQQLLTGKKRVKLSKAA